MATNLEIAPEVTSTLDQLAALRAKHGIQRKSYNGFSEKELAKALKRATQFLSFDFDDRSFYVTGGTEHLYDDAVRYLNQWRRYGNSQPFFFKVKISQKITRYDVISLR